MGYGIPRRGRCSLGLDASCTIFVTFCKSFGSEYNKTITQVFVCNVVAMARFSARQDRRGCVLGRGSYSLHTSIPFNRF